MDFFKIRVGYPAPNTPADLIPAVTEVLEIDAKSKTLIRKVKGVIKEKAKFETGKQPIVSKNKRLALVFLDSETYSFLQIEDPSLEIY